MRGSHVYLFNLVTLVILCILLSINTSYTLELTEEDFFYVTKNSIEEASIDGSIGMAAVSTVVLNRAKKSKASVTKNILFPLAFSWTSDLNKMSRGDSFYGMYWKPAECVALFAKLRWEQDNDYLTGGADHYALSSLVMAGKVEWAKSPAMHYRGTIGKHMFFEYMPKVVPRKTKITYDDWMEEI